MSIHQARHGPAVKGLQKMCSNLTIQKSQLTTDLIELQNQLSAGKISLDEYRQKKADVEKQISNCDAKLADKQQKLEMKQAGLQDIKDKVNYYDVAYVRFVPPRNDRKPPQITDRPPRFSNIDEWMKAQNAKIKKRPTANQRLAFDLLDIDYHGRKVTKNKDEKSTSEVTDANPETLNSMEENTQSETN